MSTGAVAAAAVRRAERRMIEHLREARATAPSSACEIPLRGLLGGRILRRLVRAGAVREAKGGYYLDEAAYAVYGERRRRVAWIAVGVMVALGGLVIFWASRRG